MIKVIVVPETVEFEHDVSHKNKVWITNELGEPRLEENNARYLAPYWINEDGVNRIYHILSLSPGEECSTITLGNSFVLPEKWSEMNQKRRFGYKSLSEFGFVEVCPGIIVPNK